MTIGQFATLCLQKGKSAKDTLAEVQKVFPGCKTTMKCIYYYAHVAKIPLAKKSQADPKALETALKALKAA